MKRIASAAALLTLAALVGSAADPIKVGLRLVSDGYTQPLAYASLPQGGALIIDQPGQVYTLGRDGNRTLALDLSERLSEINKGNFDERGCLCIALHPKFANNHRVFITYTAPKSSVAPADWNCALRLSEFKTTGKDPVTIDPSSEIVRLEVDKPYHNHNGGRIAFGPDGHLYLSVGDGGNGNDEGKRPETGNGQNLGVLLGKILRLDIETPAGHGIPTDNPFVSEAGVLPEIWAYGVRNPWGLTFDRGGKRELFAGDVGQDVFEEVDIIVKGGNYGWRLREGFHGFDPKSTRSAPANAPTKGARGEPLLDPILEYRHPGPQKSADALGISITGGYVYRGKALPQLQGKYVFGDWSRNFGLPQGVLAAATRPAEEGAHWPFEAIEVANPAKWAGFICAFGQDDDGELYLLTNQTATLVPGNGKVWKIVPAE